MTKGYWITAYREIRDVDKVAAYAKLAGPAVEAAGGRFLARGTPEDVREGGQSQRTVVIEFQSVAQALAAYESEAYQHALAALGEGAVRDVRFMAGV